MISVYIWIGVSPSRLHVSVRFDETFRSGMYDGTGKMSRVMTGSYFSARLTSMWSVEWLSTYLPQLIGFIFIFILICVPVGSSRIRDCVCHSWHHQFPVGSHRNCHPWTILHSTGSHVSTWFTRNCHDHSGSSHSPYVLVTKSASYIS